MRVWPSGRALLSLIRINYCRAASYTNAQSTASPANYMMLGEPALVQSGAYRAQQMAPQQPKYPPPLIPVRHMNGALQYSQPIDVTDIAG